LFKSEKPNKHVDKSYLLLHSPIQVRLKAPRAFAFLSGKMASCTLWSPINLHRRNICHNQFCMTADNIRNKEYLPLPQPLLSFKRALLTTNAYTWTPHQLGGGLELRSCIYREQSQTTLVPLPILKPYSASCVPRFIQGKLSIHSLNSKLHH
jgi:hypothetical protein